MARNLYVATDGVSLSGLNARAAELAGSSLLVSSGEEEIVRSLAQALPVIIAVRRGDKPHLVLVVQVDAESMTYVDPATGKPVRRTQNELAAERTLNGLGIVFGPSDRRAAYATPAQLAEDRRNRAMSLVKQASEHKTANAQMLLLLGDAVRADPCWRDARGLLALTARKLGSPEPDGLPACGQ